MDDIDKNNSIINNNNIVLTGNNNSNIRNIKNYSLFPINN